MREWCSFSFSSHLAFHHKTWRINLMILRFIHSLHFTPVCVFVILNSLKIKFVWFEKRIKTQHNDFKDVVLISLFFSLSVSIVVFEGYVYTLNKTNVCDKTFDELGKRHSFFSVATHFNGFFCAQFYETRYKIRRILFVIFMSLFIHHELFFSFRFEQRSLHSQ